MSLALRVYLVNNFRLTPEDADALIRDLANAMRPGQDFDLEGLETILAGYGVPGEALRYLGVF